MPHEQRTPKTMTAHFLTTQILEILKLRNRFETQQKKAEIGTPNDEYENFVNANLEATAKCISTKPRTKYRVPW